MAVDVANFIARNFNAPDRAEVDRAKYGNALMRNEVARLPQTNRAQDLGLQAAEQEISQRGTAFSDTQKQNARGILARSLSAIAQSPQPKIAAQQLIASPDFRAAGTLLGLPIDKFSVTDQDTDEVIRSGAMDWAKALGFEGEGSSGNPPGSLQELAAINADRQARGETPMRPEEYLSQRRGSSADSQLYNQYVQSLPEGQRPLPMDQFLIRFRGMVSGAQEGGQIGAQNVMKLPRVAAAQRRLDRVSQAVEAIGKRSMLKGGPFQSMLLDLTPEGQELQQSNAQLITELTALTRIPGVGSQSDLEQRLASLQLPSSQFPPQVNAKAVAELKAFMNDLSAALGGVDPKAIESAGGGAPQPVAVPKNSGGWSIRKLN